MSLINLEKSGYSTKFIRTSMNGSLYCPPKLVDVNLKAANIHTHTGIFKTNLSEKERET